MSDAVERKPWEDPSIPARVNARRIYEYALSIGGQRRRQRHRRRALVAGLVALIAVGATAGYARSRSGPHGTRSTQLAIAPGKSVPPTTPLPPSSPATAPDTGATTPAPPAGPQGCAANLTAFETAIAPPGKGRKPTTTTTAPATTTVAPTTTSAPPTTTTSAPTTTTVTTTVPTGTTVTTVGTTSTTVVHTGTTLTPTTTAGPASGATTTTAPSPTRRVRSRAAHASVPTPPAASGCSG